MPAALTKTRAVFAGWTASVAPLGPHAVGAAYAVSANVTLKATWAEIASVTVSPDDITGTFKQLSQQFSAVVTATLGVTPPQGVTWSIVGAHYTGPIDTQTDPATGIDEDGILTISKNETQTSLTIRATSKVDDTKYDETTFTLGDTSFVVNPGSGGNPIW
jgi:hypothetical protein